MIIYLVNLEIVISRPQILAERNVATKATDILLFTLKDIATRVSPAIELGWAPKVPGSQFLGPVLGE